LPICFKQGDKTAKQESHAARRPSWCPSVAKETDATCKSCFETATKLQRRVGSIAIALSDNFDEKTFGQFALNLRGHLSLLTVQV
jgi:hypothetical protein